MISTFYTMKLLLPAVPLNVDPILSAYDEFRNTMSYVDYIPDYINYTERAIKDMSADFSDFLIHCNFEGRPCNERYCYFLNSILFSPVQMDINQVL